MALRTDISKFVGCDLDRISVVNLGGLPRHMTEYLIKFDLVIQGFTEDLSVTNGRGP